MNDPHDRRPRANDRRHTDPMSGGEATPTGGWWDLYSGNEISNKVDGFPASKWAPNSPPPDEQEEAPGPESFSASSVLPEPLRAQLEALYASMQTEAVRSATAAGINVSPAQLGEAALAEAQRQAREDP